MNDVEVLQQLTSSNPVDSPVNTLGSSPAAESFPLQRCEGDCDDDADCDEGLFCMQNSLYERLPGCSGSGQRGYDYCMDLNDFDYGFVLTPTGGWVNDWHTSKPLKVNLVGE